MGIRQRMTLALATTFLLIGCATADEISALKAEIAELKKDKLASSQPEPAASPTPTATSATPSPAPTPDSTPTATPIATSTPAPPTPTVAPTSSPEPSATPSPTPEPTPSIDPTVFPDQLNAKLAIPIIEQYLEKKKGFTDISLTELVFAKKSADDTSEIRVWTSLTYKLVDRDTLRRETRDYILSHNEEWEVTSSTCDACPPEESSTEFLKKYSPQVLDTFTVEIPRLTNSLAKSIIVDFLEKEKKYANINVTELAIARKKETDLNEVRIWTNLIFKNDESSTNSEKRDYVLLFHGGAWKVSSTCGICDVQPTAADFLSDHVSY